MVQQPPRLEVASGPFKHLGPGVQLRLWLWIAVTPLCKGCGLWCLLSCTLHLEESLYCLGKADGVCVMDLYLLFIVKMNDHIVKMLRAT